MATRRRPSPSRSNGRRRSPGPGRPSLSVNPEVARSLVGLTLLVLGAVTLIALVLPGQGRLTDLWRDWIAPWFGAGRWVLPFLLMGAGWYVEWGPGSRPKSGWVAMLVGIAISFAGLLGLVQVTGLASGGRIGRFLADSLSALITPPGAFVVLAALVVIGLVIAFNVPLHALVEPVTRRLRGVQASLGGSAVGGAGDPSAGAARSGATTVGAARGRAASVSGAGSPGQTGIWGGGDGSAIPAAVPSSAPLSATFATGAAVPVGGGPGASAGASLAVGSPAGLATVPRPGGAAGVAIGEDDVIDPQRSRPSDPFDVTDAGDAPRTRERREYRLPPLSLLEDVAARNGDATMDHERNAAIITAKLLSFNIPSRVVRWNAGPVVTQYEVEPDPSIKVSRIEALSDDLAMALAARTIRIEAPIPGKSVVGIEIPNKDFNIVALRRILEEPDTLNAPSRLTFALGRDVAGHARAVDLAKMPHLLIAGATGSGKSVMVNALITSLLCRATPAEVRLILMDLKRVELASYNGVPHLLVPVITEPERAKAALKWVVNEMESRYRRFAGATSRNIAAYNESRADPEDRLPYVVVIVDELADLMMREGKNVEDPVVRLAQKARATGIHLVLATQRPSVNVVTGLIKANFPSRIAFAMASQIDSRTILDAPGAEDLIGRGDMLYQPADLPRPVRLQGVFVSDKEIHAITEHWRAEAEPHYDLSIVESDEDGTGSVDDLFDEEADRLLPDAVAVIQEYDRASASLLQRRLKIGYARAARIIDQLEARGYIGAFDGSNARQVLRRDAPVEAGRAGMPGEDDLDA